MGVLIPGVRKGAFTGQDVGGSVVQEVASLEANGGRTSDQRMMVNGVALSSGIAGGWGGGAVPNATGTSEFAIDVSGVDAQAATGGVRINFIPRDGGNRFSGTVFGSYATGDWAADNFTGTDVQAARTGGPGQRSRRTATSIPGFGGPIKRDKLWFFLSGRQLFADNYVASTFFNQNANKLDRFDYVPSPNQAILHQEQTIYQARVTWQVSPEAQDRHDLRPGELLRLHDRHRPGPRRRRHLARGRQRSPLSRCSVSSPSTGTRRSATSCCSKPAASTASNAGAAWSRRWASWATSITSSRA